MSTTNLLEETLEDLKRCDKTPADVRWVGGTKQWFTWDEFVAIANVEYDSGYGSAEVATDLKIVGDDWWLERHEYDGSECWMFKSLPEKPGDKITPTNLINGMWDSLADLQEKSS